MSRSAQHSYPTPSREAKLARLAGRQYGVVTSAQLQEIGFTRSAISRWVAGERLHRALPRVYAVGHDALSQEAR